jgi:hypothetical protein
MEASAYLKNQFGETTLRITGTQCAVAAIARVESGIIVVVPENIAFEKPRTEQRTSKRKKHARSADSAFVDALLTLVSALRATDGDFNNRLGLHRL